MDFADKSPHDETVEYLRCQIMELQQLLIYQPFGRDEGVRALEAKVDQLRGLVRARDATIETLLTSAAEERLALRVQLARTQAQAEAFAREVAALYASTAWRWAAPLRWVSRVVAQASKWAKSAIKGSNSLVPIAVHRQDCR